MKTNTNPLTFTLEPSEPWTLKAVFITNDTQMPDPSKPAEVNPLWDGTPQKFKTRQDIHEEPIYPAGSGIIPSYRLGDVLLIPMGDDNDPLTRNAAYQPQDRMAFSPLPSQPLSIEGLALLGIIFNFARTKEGSKSLERIIIKYLDSCTKIIESVQDACHSNWLTALNNQHITLAVAHRIGLIDDAGYLKTLSHYQSVFDKMLKISAFETTFQGITTLVQGAKTTQVGLGGEQSEAGGLPAVIGMLAKAAVV